MSIIVDLFTKEKINNQELINRLGVHENKILFLKEISDLADKKDQAIAIEYRGKLEDDDTDEYIGYNYYVAYVYNEEFAEKLKNLNNKNFIVKVLR